MKRGRGTSDGDSETPVDEKSPPAQQARLTNKGDEIKIGGEERHVVVTNTCKYENVVRSAAFVDKTKHIRSLFDFEDSAKTLLFAAPFRCGKSTNMDMVKKFLSQEVDGSGKPKINVTWNEKTGWEEKAEDQQTASFKLFKKLEIYKCHHHEKTPASGQCQSSHTEADCKRERCEPNHYCKLGLCEPDHDEDECKRGGCGHRNFFYKHCGKHIVVFFNLSSVGYGDVKAVNENLKGCLQDTFLEHRYLEKSSHLSLNSRNHISKYIDAVLHSTAEVSRGLKYLVQYLVEHFKKVDGKQETSSPPPNPKVFVLIEEYDAHISSLLRVKKNVSEDDIMQVTDTISMVIASVLKDNSNVIGGLVNACRNITGTLSQHANNIQPVEFLEDPLFAGYCGFTADEVNKLLSKSVFRNVDRGLLDDYYNGYHVLGYPNQNVYNTYSIVQHLNEWVKLREAKRNSPQKGDVQPKHYYVARGVAKLEEMFAIDGIREQILCMLEGQEVPIVDKNEKFTVHELFLLKKLLHTSAGKGATKEQITLFLHYLKHHGYIFATEKKGLIVKLAIPNTEIVSVFHEKLWVSSFYDKKYNVMPVDYVNALRGLNVAGPETFQVLATAISNMFPTERPSRHDELKGILFAYAFQSHDLPEVESKPYVVEGRRFQCDLKIWRRDGVGIVLEVASGDKKEDEALQQIFTNHYCESLDKNVQCTGKIYIGLHYDYERGDTKICAYATDGETVTSRCPEEKDCISVSWEKQ